MLYVKSLSLDRFKSFKHASLLFSKGFNCIVGPNGSGKSNICDALLFCLGEGSLHRLRANRLEALINFSSTKKSGLSTASTKVCLGGGKEEVTIVRALRSDGKSLYRLNGKRMTRQEVMEVLKGYGIHVDETSTITQGEISRMIELNPKERRVLIELASGVMEFEQKKREALSELDKVTIKINEATAVLGERTGFLKELEREKAAAEQFLALTKRLKSLSFSILNKRKEAVVLALDTYRIDAEAQIKKKDKGSAALAKLTERINGLEAERQALTKKLSESTGALGEMSRKLEAVGKESSALSATIASNSKAVTEAEKFISDAEKEILVTKKGIVEKNAAIKEIKERLSALEPEIKKLKGGKSGAAESVAEMLKDEGKAIEELERSAAALSKRLSELTESWRTISSKAEETAKELSALKEKKSGSESLLADTRTKLESLAKQKTTLQSELTRLEQEEKGIDSEIGKAEENVLELRARRAETRPRSTSLKERLGSVFKERDGFYGLASELCSYDTKYADAVEAAASGRFGYFVVDSIDVASSVIDHLKKSNLGRATFIPLKEVIVHEAGKGEGTAVLDVLDFDEKFRKAFAYIFSDTYIVGDIAEARRRGLSKHRYVTLSGEVLERSGTLSGGYDKTFSPASLEKKIKELESRLEELRFTKKGAETSIFDQRKKIAHLEIEAEAAAKAENSVSEELRECKESTTALETARSKLSVQITSAKEEKEKTEATLAKTTKEISTKRDALSREYDEALKSMASHGMRSVDVSKLEQLNKESEELKIRNAALQAETDALERRLQEYETSSTEKKSELERLRSSIAEDAKKLKELEKKRIEIEHEVASSDKTHKNVYGRLDAINSETLALGAEQGRVKADLDAIERQISEIENRRGQAEVRLNDLTAELTAFDQTGIEVLKAKPEEMEEEKVIITSKINELGQVNMKAPEMYQERKKSVDESFEKLNTLGSEKSAIITMIEEIDSRKLGTFMATFNEVNKNFSKLYNYIFPGEATIALENEKSPFEGGLEVKIQDGKAHKRVDSMSGGEKTLVLIMLIFAIHMCKPASVHILDEIDAALDKENSRKLSQLIKELSKEAQFIVVSHNDSLIVNADAAIGVVKSENVSNVVGIEVSNVVNK